MPVFKRISEQNRPDWCQVTSAGTFRVPREGGTFDNHYHDCDEYWLICKGRALVKSEGIEYLVEPGDIICTQAGADHDVLEVFEDIEAFWFEDATPPGGRTGHLHRTPEDAAGHPVAAG
jgi:mannose-6-phosphate isomerase-like protein (cupin superfamily)